MPQIPLHQGGGVQPTVEFPRPVPKAALIAHLGAQALDSSAALERTIFKDRERRDYNENLIDANRALNMRNAEAQQSNDPRSMLSNFNKSMEEDLSAIRGKIANPLLQRDFDNRTQIGVEKSRYKILDTQLKYEREESALQLKAAADTLIDAVALDTSNASLDWARDEATNLTEQAIETLSLSPEQAKAMNKGLFENIDNQILDSLIAADKHTEAKERLLAGDFRSVRPKKVEKLLDLIQTDMQDGNFDDIWYKLADGGSSYQLGENIKKMQKRKELNDRQARQLYAMNKANLDKFLSEKVTGDLAMRFFNGVEGAYIDPGNKDHQKSVDIFIKNQVDPQIAMAREKTEAAGQPWPATRTAEIRSGYIDKLNGIIPTHWRDYAVASVMSMEVNPEESVGNARLLQIAGMKNPGMMGEISRAAPLAGQRVQKINYLKQQNFTTSEIMQEILRGELIVKDLDQEAHAKSFDTMVAADPRFMELAFMEGMLNTPAQYSNGESYRDRAQAIAFRQGNVFGLGEMTGLSVEEQSSAYQASKGKKLPEIVDIVQDDESTRQEGAKIDLASGIVSKMFYGLTGQETTAALFQSEGKQYMSTPTLGILNKMFNFGEGDSAIMQIEPGMMSEFNHHFRTEYLRNGGDRPGAIAWAMDHVTRNWSPTEYEGTPRWARGAVEANYPQVNGSWDWTRDQLADHLGLALLEQLDPLRDRGVILPTFKEGDDYETFRREVMDVLSIAAQDDPNSTIVAGELPDYARISGYHWRERLEDAGLIKNFPFNVFANWKDPDMSGITSFTTQESLEQKNDRGETVAARHIRYRGRDGGYHPITALSNNQDQAAAFYYDVTLNADWQANHREELISDAKALIRGMMSKGSGETAIRAEMDRLGLGSVGLKQGFKLRIPGYDTHGEITGFPNKRDFAADDTPFDREAFLEAQKQERAKRLID
jgi:hypothetical protein